ncbi:MAG: porin family protein [Puia sp.]|nr:porin family protein [Puia sp.]
MKKQIKTKEAMGSARLAGAAADGTAQVMRTEKGIGAKMSIQKILFISCVCLFSLAALPAAAQFSAGVAAGINFATQPTSEYYHQTLVRPYGGLYAQYKLKIPIDFRVGLNYSGEGVKLKDEGTGDTYNSSLSYLNIPVFVQYRFSFGGYVEAGVQPGILLSAKEKDNGGASFDTKQYYKSSDFGAGVGVGYECKGGLGFNARYIRGLAAVNKAGTSTEDLKNRMLSIGLTYRLIKIK